MKLPVFRRPALFSTLFAGVFGVLSASAQLASFNGSYTQNFDALGASGTTMPLGFGVLTTGSANSTYTAASPINAAGIASSVAGNQTLVIWSPGTKPTSAGSQAFNDGFWGSSTDRALGSDPTGTSATVLQLAMTNNTGAPLFGVTFSYDCKCLTNGLSGTTPGTEQNELPGYCFFYSTTGTNTAANWTEVGFAGTTNDPGGIPVQHGLCLPNYTPGTTMSSGAVNITFATPLPNGAAMYFRWADDNNQPLSPDEDIAIDNISIATFTPPGPVVNITLPVNGASVSSGTVTLQASTSDLTGIVTNVSYFLGATLIGQATTAPYTVNWANVLAGNYSLTAQATDNSGLMATSSIVSVSVTNPIVASFTGSYAQNFDLVLSNSTTTMPPGFLALGLAGSHFTFTNGTPIDTNAIAATTSGTAALTLWNFGTAVKSAGSGLFNIGTWTNVNDRALGSDPTGIAGTVIQLALANNSGNALAGVTFSYDELVLTNGTTSNGAFTDDGTESLELPGYSFFYSLTGDSNATNWFEVNTLCLTNWVQGQETPSGPVTITFPKPLAVGGAMYFRWADDNCVASSPDQMIAIDNVSVTAINNGPVVSFITPTNTQSVIPSTSLPVSLNVSDTVNPVTNVAFYVSGKLLFNFTSAPYTLSIPSSLVQPGTYALTAVAMDNGGLITTSAVVNVVVAFAPPVISITNPSTGSSYPASANISISATASSVDANVTNVAFYQGTTLLTNEPAGPYNFTWVNVPAGTFNLTAVASDDRGLSTTSGVVTVTATNGFGLPVVNLTSPANNAVFPPGSNIGLAATASEDGGLITNVQFFANSLNLGGTATAPYGITWPNVAIGNYAITAVAADTAGNLSTSAVVNISVTAVHLPPTVSLTFPATNAALDVAQGLTLSATASSPNGTVTNVAFYLNTFLLVNLTNGVANTYSYKLTNAPTGDYTLKAVAWDNTGVTNVSVVSVVASNSIVLATLHQIKTFFIIPLENHDLVQSVPTGSPQQLLNNPACPYFNSLITPGNTNAAQAAYTRTYFSTAIGGEHPSEPNYLWSEAGTDFGIRNDGDPSSSIGNIFSNVKHLAGQLTTAGISWRSYQEDLQYSSSEETSASGSGVAVNPYNGTTQFSYAVKHNPMAFFTDTQNKNCFALTNFWTDLTNNNIGRYNWITPNQFNEMHSALNGGYTYHGVAFTGDQAAIASGDNALSIIIPQIMASQAYKDHGVIIIWTDETESTDDTNTTLPYVIISSLAKTNAYASPLAYSHSSDLKTMDEVFGLDYQTNAIPAGWVDAQNNAFNYVNGSSAIINDLADFFVSVSMVSLGSSENPAGNKDNVTFTATVTGGTVTPTGTVQFITNGVSIGAPVTLNHGSASFNTALLPRGTNTVMAIYSGDSNNLSGTNSLLEIVTNHPPVAGTVFYPRNAGTSLLINIANLLTNVTDVDGDAITLVGVGVSTNGSTILNNGTFLFYTNTVPSNLNDSFQYVVTDGQGGTNVGTVNIVMNNNAIIGQGNPQLAIGTSTVTANFFGIPGFQYIVQRSTNLTVGEGWISISTNIAPTNGLMQVIDAFQDLGIPIPPVPASVFYRLEYNPNH